MFKYIRVHPENLTVKVTLNGKYIEVPIGHTVATTMLISQQKHSRRSPVSGEQRGPFCLMGTCFECLVEIDGVPNQQACMTEVKDGMDVRTEVTFSNKNMINKQETL